MHFNVICDELDESDSWIHDCLVAEMHIFQTGGFNKVLESKWENTWLDLFNRCLRINVYL